MIRKHRRWLALLVPPALVFRALIPVGFMPLVDADGGITIGFCPGEATPLAFTAGLHAYGGDHHAGTHDVASTGHHHQLAAHGAHQHHHGADGSEDLSTSGQHHAPCLFAASAGGAPASAILTLEARAPEASNLVRDDAAAVFLPTILRAQSPRGPPVFS